MVVQYLHGQGRHEQDGESAFEQEEGAVSEPRGAGEEQKKGVSLGQVLMGYLVGT